MKRSSKVILLRAFVILILGASILSYYLYTKSFHTLNISFSDSSLRAEIYPASLGDGATELSYQKTLIKKVNKSERIKLKKGIYIIKSPATGNFKEYLVRVNLQDGNKEIKLNPSYNEQVLKKILSNQVTSIHNEIILKYPRIKSLYNIDIGKLYNKGNWYATTLKYRDHSDLYQSDTLRIILSKEKGQWKIITTPPQIVISKIVYPNIPPGIIDDINSIE